MAINMNGINGADVAAKGKAISQAGSFFSKIQDASHFTGNATLQGSRWKAGATTTAFSAVAGAGIGGTVGGIGGALSDDSSFFSGAAKGAAIGAGLTGATNLGMIGYGRQLGKSPYTYKTSMYTNAGISPGATFKENSNIAMRF